MKSNENNYQEKMQFPSPRIKGQIPSLLRSKSQARKISRVSET